MPFEQESLYLVENHTINQIDNTTYSSFSRKDKRRRRSGAFWRGGVSSNRLTMNGDRDRRLGKRSWWAPRPAARAEAGCYLLSVASAAVARAFASSNTRLRTEGSVMR